MGTHYRGSAKEVRALDLLIKLMRATKSVTERLDAHLGGSGLSENQFGVLEILLHLGPQNPNVIGDKLFTSRPNVTLLVDTLEKRGFVERRRCTEDRRLVY